MVRRSILVNLPKLDAPDAQAYRVINFCDLEAKTEFRLVTNLPSDGEAAVSDDEIRDIYRLRWGVELGV